MKKPLKAIGVTFLVIVWFYSVSFLSSFIIQLIAKEPLNFLNRHGYLVNILCYLVIFLGVFLLDKNRKQFIKALKPRRFLSKQTIYYIVMGLGSYVIGTIIIILLIQFFPDYQELNESFNGHEPILRFLMIVIAAPLVEEYLFRHIVQNNLENSFIKPIAIIGQAICFGCLHHYNLQKIYATALGTLFGFVKERRGIEATIWMHMTVNFIGWCIGSFLQ